MSKKKKTGEIPTSTEINKVYQLKSNPFTSVEDFNKLDGEVFAGLNILKLQPGQAAGPIQITAILLSQKLGKGKVADKRKPVDVYEGLLQGAKVRLPAAASLVGKLHDAKVKVGDVIAILRGDDYESAFKTRGASYTLKVISRA